MTIIVTGAKGMLGPAVVQALRERTEGVVGLTRHQLDIRNIADVEANLSPDDVVFNCAGIVKGSGLRRDTVVMTNVLGPQLLAYRTGRLIQISTDCVFDGRDGDYGESELPSPVDLYGVSKLAGEITWAPHLTIRCSFVGFGPRGLLSWLLGQPPGAVIRGYDTWHWNGLYVQTVARIIADLGLSSRTGVVHVHAAKSLTKWELLSRVGAIVRPDVRVLRTSINPAKYMTLRSELLQAEGARLSHTWDEMLEELAKDFNGGVGRAETGLSAVPR